MACEMDGPSNLPPMLLPPRYLPIETEGLVAKLSDMREELNRKRMVTELNFGLASFVGI